MKEKIILFGGTFDPPHLGHLGLARTVLRSKLVQELWFVPCLTHRFRKQPAAYEHRVAMCRLLIAAESNMKVSTIEARLEKPGYTLAMVQRLKKENAKTEFRLVAGTDIYHEKDAWYHFEEIEKLAPPIYVERKGVANIPDTTLTAPMEVSSSELRALLAQGQRPLDKLPEPVLEYILRNDLYT